MNNAKRYVVAYNVTKNGAFHRNSAITLAAGVTPIMWRDTANQSYAGMISSGLTEDVFKVEIQSFDFAE